MRYNHYSTFMNRKLAYGVIGGLLLAAGGAVWLEAKPIARRSIQTNLPVVMQVTTTPVVGTATATPALITVNTPTTVTVTVQITDPRLLTNGVNLLRLNSNGSSSILGVMHDDGVNGDAVANDKLFSLTVNLNEKTTSEIQFQVSCAFKGILKRVLSPIIYTPVIPPDPGPSGMATVGGVDSDNDGIRDDVERYIAVTFPQSERLRLALQDDAKATQQLLLSTTPDQAINATTRMLRAVECLSYLVPTGSDRHVMLSQLDAIQINTEARFLAWTATDDNTRGQIYDASSNPKASCTFNPDTVAN